MINNVQKVRKLNGLTQEELARICDVSLRQIQNIEANKNIPKVDLAIKIKKALKCENIEDLFIID